jgi:hypothetical protein
MKNWAKQLAGAVLVLVFALAVGGFVLVLRAQQQSLASTMAAAHIRAVSPPDGATNVPVMGEIRADYLSRPAHDPAIVLDPVAGITLDNSHWDGTSFVIDYRGLRENSLYHAELDQDDASQAGGQNDVKQSGQHKQSDSTQTGDQKQINVRWSFRTGTLHAATPTPTPIVSTPTPTPTISVTPTASPSPTPGLIWYSGDSTPGTIAASGIDWNAKAIKTVRWVGTLQAPDGRLIYNATTPSTDIYDADGNMAGSIAGSPAMWADDSRQFCGISYQAASATRNLLMLRLDGSVHTVGPVALQDGAGKPVQTVSVVACSGLTGRAVVVGSSDGFNWSMAMISLTDGSVIYQMRYPNPPTRFAASHDGHYVAEQIGGGSATLIRELPSGTVVGQVTGITVQGFSWDGTLVAGGIQGNSGFTGAEVIRWQDRQVVWNRCGCPSPFQVSVIAQPDGSKLAVGTLDQHRMGTLTIVDASGAAQPVVANKPILLMF